jgi:hypothetical protein
MNEVILTGLDGANPLGFLAALGALNVVAADRDARLLFREDGAWRPVLYAENLDLEALLTLIEADLLDCKTEAALDLEYDGTRDLKPPPAIYRAFLEGLVAQVTPDTRRGVDWAASFASDVVVDNNGNTKPTALHFTAGQQTWLSMARALRDGVTRDQLAEALVGPWQYQGVLPVMGWDATAARDYALRASNPSFDKKSGNPGADWLAVRGLPFVGVAPRGSRVLTTGCVGEWKTGRFAWPLWSLPLDRTMVMTAIRLPGLRSMPDPERLARGICAVYECGIRRSDQGGYGSFTPPAAL